MNEDDTKPDWAQDNYDPTEPENYSRFVMPLYTELRDFHEKIGYNPWKDDEGKDITDSSVEPGTPPSETAVAPRLGEAPPPSETAVKPYLLTTPPPSDTASVARPTQPTAASPTIAPRPQAPAPQRTAAPAAPAQKTEAPAKGFFDGVDYQSNNRPVLENGQINWGDPNNPADFVRASNAFTSMRFGKMAATDKGVQQAMAYAAGNEQPAEQGARPTAYAATGTNEPAPFRGVRQQGTGFNINIPFVADDLSKYATYARAGEPLQGVEGVIFHHTGGHGSPRDIVNVLNQRGLGVQYIMDRDGTIYQALPNGSRGAHMRPGETVNLSNANAIGIEMIAQDNDDVTPAQVKSAQRFYAELQKQFPTIQPYGHGEVNRHKMTTEGMAAVDAIRAVFGLKPQFETVNRAPLPMSARTLKGYRSSDYAEGGRVPLLQDQFPTHYLPDVGRQVMNSGGTPEDDAVRLAYQITTDPMGNPTVAQAQEQPEGKREGLYERAVDVMSAPFRTYAEKTKEAAEHGSHLMSESAKSLRMEDGRLPINALWQYPMGAMGTILSPFTGAAETLGEGVTQATGNPEAGSRAAFIASMADPSHVKAAMATIPMAVRAKQAISSAETSLNQVPALFKSKHFDAPEGSRNLDIGGGKYDKGTEYLASERKVDSKVYDPFNRPDDHNAKVLQEFSANPADTVTAANVLNVIKEPEARQQVIQQAFDNLKPGGKAFFDIYEGNKSGVGKETTKGWQNNAKAQEFEKEILSVFPNVQRKGSTLIATKGADEEARAVQIAAQAAGGDDAAKAVELAKSIGPTPRNIEIPRSQNLSPEEQKIETRLADKISKDPHAAMAEYAGLKETENGKILNTDNARELSPDYAASNDTKSRYSAAVHEPASWLTKWMYEQKLKQPPSETELPMVLFTAGGTGAGKTSAIENIPQMSSLAKEAQIIFDTNMNGYASSKKKIDQALEAGKEAGVVYVYRDPIEALENGALPRAMRMGRTVPLNEHLKTHVESANTIRQLANDYAGNPNVKFMVIDNSRGRGQAAMTTLDAIQPERYNVTIDQLKSALDKAYADGKISKSVYEGTLGQAAP